MFPVRGEKIFWRIKIKSTLRYLHWKQTGRSSLSQTEEEFNSAASEPWCATCDWLPQNCSMHTLCKHMEPVQVLHLGPPDPVRHFWTRSAGRAWQTRSNWLHFSTLPDKLCPVWLLQKPHSGSTPELVSPCRTWAGLVYILFFFFSLLWYP